jgi:prolipoprotein diacylglyceryl transferase
VLLASIPSPSNPFVFHLGPLAPRWYGILLAAGILLAILITRRQLELRGRDPALAGQVAVWAVPCGVVGARLYHVATDWSAFSGHLENIPLVQQGGLGIYGALLGGALGAVIGARRAGVPLLVILDCAAPGVALAQALGRFGNYFNQELFGGPTSLPWGLEIDPEHRPPQYLDDSTFHPTFLYESLWNLLVMGVLLRVARRWRRLAPGYVLALYLALYSLGRFFVEGLRVDPAHELGPLRLNQVVAAIVFALSLVALARLRRRAPESSSA